MVQATKQSKADALASDFYARRNLDTFYLTARQYDYLHSLSTREGGNRVTETNDRFRVLPKNQHTLYGCLLSPTGEKIGRWAVRGKRNGAGQFFATVDAAPLTDEEIEREVADRLLDVYYAAPIATTYTPLSYEDGRRAVAEAQYDAATLDYQAPPRQPDPYGYQANAVRSEVAFATATTKPALPNGWKVVGR